MWRVTHQKVQEAEMSQTCPPPPSILCLFLLTYLLKVLKEWIMKKRCMYTMAVAVQIWFLQHKRSNTIHGLLIIPYLTILDWGVGPWNNTATPSLLNGFQHETCVILNWTPLTVARANQHDSMQHPIAEDTPKVTSSFQLMHGSVTHFHNLLWIGTQWRVHAGHQQDI